MKVFILRHNIHCNDRRIVAVFYANDDIDRKSIRDIQAKCAERCYELVERTPTYTRTAALLESDVVAEIRIDNDLEPSNEWPEV